MIRKVYSSPQDFKAQNEELNLHLPYTEDLSVFKKELKIKNKVIPNRLACQAMEGCDGTPEGSPGELTVRRYDRFSKGGAGLIWFEATAARRESRANPRQLFIRDDNMDDFKREVERIKTTGLKGNGYEPIVIMQDTHSGRYSRPNGFPEPLIAYHNPIFEKDNPISSDRIVTDEYLDSVRDSLVHAAELAEKAGFDGVDIKACHRYLDSELLSAFLRPGRYGGSLENRTRLLRESVQGAIERCDKNFIVSSRMNAYDGFPYPYGFGVRKDDSGSLEFDPTEPVWLIQQLQAMGVEILNITMGNPYFNPHVNRPFAMGPYETKEHPLEGVARILQGTAILKKAVPDMKFICSAVSFLGVAAPHVTGAFIEQGAFDVAGFGRTIFAYPDFAKDILSGKGMTKDKICLCCSKCTQIMRQPGGTPGCVIRDRDPYAEIYKKLCVEGK